MAKTDFKTVDDLHRVLSERLRRILNAVREAIRKAALEAAEVISYQLPAYKLGCLAREPWRRRALDMNQ